MVEFRKPDGSVLSATLEPRKKEGTWALDLRSPFKRGRPTMKRPGERHGVKSLAEARELAVLELRNIAAGTGAITPAAARKPEDMVMEYLTRRVASGRMRVETAAKAQPAILGVWEILRDQLGLTSWSQFGTEHAGPLGDIMLKRTYRGKKTKRNTVVNHINYTKGFVKHLVTSKVLSTSPLHDNDELPQREEPEAGDWLEPWEMGLLLETSFDIRARGEYPHNACHAWPEILATQAYTGAREREILGLATRDVKLTGGDHGAGTIRLVASTHRRLKNTPSDRTVHLWPAHRDILRSYIAREKPPADGLFFPGRDGGMWGELRGSMSRDLKASGLKHHITDHRMRHSALTARSRMYVEVVRGGRVELAPVHLSDLIREFGHASERMARAVYIHASEHRVPGWTVLDYAAALEEHRRAERKKGLGGRAGKRSATSKRTASKRSGSATTGRRGPT